MKVMLDFKTIKDSTKGELNTKKTNLLVSKNLYKTESTKVKMQLPKISGFKINLAPNIGGKTERKLKQAKLRVLSTL